jgi:hypothetical protein
LRCLNHLEGWDEGEIRIGGRQLGYAENGRRLSPREIALECARVGVGMVFHTISQIAGLVALIPRKGAGALRALPYGDDRFGSSSSGITHFKEDYVAMNETYRQFFPPNRLPARTCVGVTGLAYDARIEIDLVCRRPSVGE